MKALGWDSLPLATQRLPAGKGDRKRGGGSLSDKEEPPKRVYFITIRDHREAHWAGGGPPGAPGGQQAAKRDLGCQVQCSLPFQRCCPGQSGLRETSGHLEVAGTSELGTC